MNEQTYWALCVGDYTEAEAIKAHGLAGLGRADLLAWLEANEIAAAAAGAVFPDSVEWMRKAAAIDLAAAMPEPLRVVSVRKIPAPGRGVAMAPAIYQPRKTGAGRWIWSLAESRILGTLIGGDGKDRELGVYSEAKANRLADAMAEERGIPVWPGVRHNESLTDWEIDQFVAAAGVRP